MQIFVTPNKGARVRMPDRNSAVMSEKGAWINRDVHYETLIANGDVIVADPQPAHPATDALAPADKSAAPRASSKEK